MEVKFTYTKEEWVDGRRKYLFLAKILTRMQLVIMSLMTVLFTVSTSIYGFGIINTALGVILALLVLELLVVYGIQPSMLYNETDKYHSGYRFVFREDGFLFETQGIASELKWDIYTGYAQSGKYYYLLQGKINYTLIPKRVFTSEQDREIFEKIINSVLREIK